MAKKQKGHFDLEKHLTFVLIQFPFHYIKLRARVKIEGEKRRKRQSSSESSDSSSSESADESIPTFAATTRMTLSERFGKMAQWSADRGNMDNLKTMRITKDSAGGPVKVRINQIFESQLANTQIM